MCERTAINYWDEAREALSLLQFDSPTAWRESHVDWIFRVEENQYWLNYFHIFACCTLAWIYFDILRATSADDVELWSSFLSFLPGDDIINFNFTISAQLLDWMELESSFWLENFFFSFFRLFLIESRIMTVWMDLKGFSVT